MAEAEEVITDVARVATAQMQDWWRRRRGVPPTSAPRLADVIPRLSLLLDAVFARRLPVRVAQPPPPPTWLGRWQERRRGPRPRQALPATDGQTLWLPADSGRDEPDAALRRFRLLALLHGQRVLRGSAGQLPTLSTSLERDLFLLQEAQAAENDLLRALPGLAGEAADLRREALARRPPLAAFPAWRRPLESELRALLAAPADPDAAPAPGLSGSAEASAAMARERASAWRAQGGNRHEPEADEFLFKDLWTGELLPPPDPSRATATAGDTAGDDRATTPPRRAWLARRPRERKPADDEDDARPGAWMVQTASPHEKAEDPVGLQRPTDRDETTAAEDFAESLAELPEARLVSTPGRPREVLLSEDPPAARSQRLDAAAQGAGRGIRYPEWDCRRGDYGAAGATVHLLAAPEGPPAWVDATLRRHQARLAPLRRQFAMLQALRVRRRRLREGDDIDLEAWMEAQADYRAGRPLAQDCYQSWRAQRRDLAVLLLVDVSGSTDGWVSTTQRVIDVEKEALLLVSLALEQLREPAAILAFSGAGPQGVGLRQLKDFREPWSAAVGRRIAALEPEEYTRAGAALRHASAALMAQPAHHRLLLLLSDGKPNDVDIYEGRYGVEDMRQAVTEALAQGISPFCLTVDRQAPGYLPAVFGAHRYALLQEPSRLPLVLLDWLRRLLAA